MIPRGDAGFPALELTEGTEGTEKGANAKHVVGREDLGVHNRSKNDPHPKDPPFPPLLRVSESVFLRPSAPSVIPWHGACFRMDIVKSLRTVFSAFALIVALIGVSTVPAYAGPVRPSCVPAVKGAHDCCKTPVLKACCPDRSDTSNQGAPAQSKVQVTPNFTAAPAMFVADLALVVRSVAAEQTHTRGGPGDLPTLLSTLLI